MGANTDSKIWYLARNGKRHGPISEIEMNKLVEMGHLKPQDLVWRPGFEEWKNSSSVFSPTKTKTETSKTLERMRTTTEQPKATNKKVFDPTQNKVPYDRSTVVKTETTPQQKSQKDPQFKDETFQWDIYYEGEDGPEFQYYKESIETAKTAHQLYKANKMPEIGTLQEDQVYTIYEPLKI